MKKNIFILALISIFSLGITLSSCNDKEKKDDVTEVVDNSQANNEVISNDTNSNSGNNINITPPKGGKVHKLTSKEFKENIFDYMTNSEWTYKGSMPCVIDFYADWCGPCKMVAPIMDELAKEYDGKVVFYKVDVDVENEVASVFGIQSIPSILYIPVNGEPQMSAGAMQKEGYKNAIEQVLEVK